MRMQHARSDPTLLHPWAEEEAAWCMLAWWLRLVIG